jgi:hypothetical protein
MNILDLVPVGWFSADMNVFSNGVLLAELQFSRWRENGSIVSEQALRISQRWYVQQSLSA